MAASNQVSGEFSFKAITITQIPGPAGGVLTQVNWEGTAAGFGAVFSTTTYSGHKTGTFSECAVSYSDNGDAISGIGQGTFESDGKHHWSTKAFMQLSDGRKIAIEGQVDLASRSYKGKVVREIG
jgi:hypothetical protein